MGCVFLHPHEVLIMEKGMMKNKKRKCVFCKERFYVDTGIVAPVGFFCGMDHVKLYANKEKQKTQKKVNNELKRQFKLKDKKYRKEKAQYSFNAYIRKRDEHLPCVSCDKPNTGTHQRHASHYRSVGACPELRFEELNVHASCAQCNSMKSGNIIEYRIRLIKKIGEEKVIWIESQNYVKKYTCEDYLKIEKKYKKKLKDLSTQPLC